MTAYIERDAAQAKPFATSPPVWVHVDGTNAPASGWGFDASADEQVFFEFIATGYSSGNVTVEIDWYADSATSGNVVWTAAIAAVTPGDAQDWETDAFATANTVTDAAGAGQYVQRASITVSNLDSMAADDRMRLRITRDADSGSDTMTGDAILVGIRISYADS
jgi:hypothetical protein